MKRFFTQKNKIALTALACSESERSFSVKLADCLRGLAVVGEEAPGDEVKEAREAKSGEEEDDCREEEEEEEDCRKEREDGSAEHLWLWRSGRTLEAKRF